MVAGPSVYVCGGCQDTLRLELAKGISHSHLLDGGGTQANELWRNLIVDLAVPLPRWRALIVWRAFFGGIHCAAPIAHKHMAPIQRKLTQSGTDRTGPR